MLHNSMDIINKKKKVMKQMMIAMAAGVAVGYFICKIQAKSKKYRATEVLHLGKGIPGAKENHAWGQDKNEIEYL